MNSNSLAIFFIIILLYSFVLFVKKIPATYPKKWDNNGFNAMNLVLSMSNINSFESKGSRVGFICSPKINSTHHDSSIEIINKDFYLLCNADFLTIDGITPYIDERWD
ncbi:Imm50 family immunity protein [Xenorhabdus nematophila]|uniref:Imm50 family immunity protein n=1 Tax=Xenorhabdus nematophila TaxID=628 RepID=UPI000690C377|nr:Imm50 family immunity protein [Xenorhabdus nematophila]